MSRDEKLHTAVLVTPTAERRRRRKARRRKPPERRLRLSGPSVAPPSTCPPPASPARRGCARRADSVCPGKAERDELADERTKLLRAHYAGAVPLDLLAGEQDRIARRLAFLDAQIQAGAIKYEQAKAHLDDCLSLAGDCHAIYMSMDDSLRRIANQAYFDKLIVTPDDTIGGEPGEPFNIFFNPAVQ